MYEMRLLEIGTAEAFLMYGRRLRGIGKHTRRVFRDGLLGRCDYFLRNQKTVTPSSLAGNLPPPLPAEWVSSGPAAEKNERPGFLRAGCASAGLRIGPGGLAVPGKPSRVAQGAQS